MINIDNLISEAVKTKSPALGIYRLIKAEFLRWQKDNPGKEFEANTEQKILKKMFDQRKESERIYREAGREELADKEAFESSILYPFLPKEVSPEEIEKLTKSIIESDYSGKVTMKDMKSILSKVQVTYPGASGQIVSKVVKSYV